MLPRQQVLRSLWCRNSFASLQTGPWVFSGTGIACFPDSRPCGVCGHASRLRPCKPALGSFQARKSHISPTTGPAVFVVPQFVCIPANRTLGLFRHGHVCFPDSRPCGVCGHAIRLRSCKPALWSFRARALHVSPTTGPAVFAVPQFVCYLLTGPSVFSGTGIACLPISRHCGVCGAAICLRPC